MKTQFRKIIKRKHKAGIPLVQILHPRTKVINPISEKPSHGVLALLFNKKGVLNSFIGSNPSNKVAKDLKNAARIYEAFSVNPDGDDAIDRLSTAIQNYTTTTKKKDKQQLTNELLKVTVAAIQGHSAADIKASYKRKSSTKTAITLNRLAAYLGIETKPSDTDIKLAQKISNELN